MEKQNKKGLYVVVCDMCDENSREEAVGFSQFTEETYLWTGGKDYDLCDDCTKKIMALVKPKGNSIGYVDK